MKQSVHIGLGMLALATTGALSASVAQAHPFAFDTTRMVGFVVLTAEDGAVSTEDTVVIEYDGPIVFPMAENLQEIWTEIASQPRFRQVILRLNSPGGTQAHGEEVIGLLHEMREHVELVTLVGENDLCASMCIPVFIQGTTRFASPASAWMFHGAARHMSNVPSLSMTMRYVGYFKDRGVGTDFVSFLVDSKYLVSPGEYWLSGSDLAGASNIVTKLVPSWRPAAAELGPHGGVQSGI